MPLPAGIDTCTVTMNVPLDALGNLAVSVIGNVRPDRYLVWQATGEPILEIGAKIPTSSGGVITMTLPTTNQSGIVDSEGNAVTNWSYRIWYKATFANRQKADYTKPFQIDQALTSLDLDSVPFGNVVTPAVTAPSGVVSSVAGLTGVVSASGLENALDVVGAGVARFVARANAGATLKIVGLGDSITAGAGATLGVNDFMTVLLGSLQSRFSSATITQSNRGLSGATTATSAITGNLSSAITDAGDLYVIGFGRNDIQADDTTYTGQPVQGYKRLRSLRYFEVMIRAIRAAVPTADILLMTENPASTYSSDTNMRTYQQGVRDLARAYGCELADTYAAYGTSGYSSLLSDSVHPSVSGHALYASTILARIPATLGHIAAGRASTTYSKGLRTPETVDTAIGSVGWTIVNGSAPTSAYVQSGAGWNAIYPRETSTANDYMEWTFTGTDFGIRVDQTTGAAPVVDIAIDGVTTLTNQSLYLIPGAFQLYQFLATGLSDGQHTIRVTLKTGTLRWYQAAWLAGAPAVSTLGISGGLRKMVTGRYYTQRRGGGGTTPISFPTTGTIYCVPLWVPKATSFDRLGVFCSTAAASSTVTLGVYESDANDQPGTQLLTTAALDTSTTGWKEATISLSTTGATWLWLAALTLGGSPRFHGSEIAHDIVVSTAQTFVNALNGYFVSGASALPAPWTSTTAVTLSPLIGLRAA